MEYREMLEQPEYAFLRTDIHLGQRILLLGMAGSISYGTNHEGSDVDVRGIALNRKEELLGLSKFEQYIDEKTDTVIYSLNKIIPLLLDCNPNTIEMLGLLPEHYLYVSPAGRELLEHRHLFLSKRAVHSFGGYAGQQLRRLQNALARDAMEQGEQERHICNSIKNAMYDFERKYQNLEEGSLRLYVDKAVNPDMNSEIFMDVSLTHYPLRDYKGMWGEMNNIVKEYGKIGKRNHKKDDAHLNKHAMHLIRLFMMAIDILEKEEIVTYRSAEHTLLMDIRNGAFQKEDGAYRQEFYDLLSEYERRLSEAAALTNLPDNPDTGAVEKLMIRLNEMAVRELG